MDLDFIMQEFRDTEQSEAQGDMCKDRLKPDQILQKGPELQSQLCHLIRLSPLLQSHSPKVINIDSQCVFSTPFLLLTQIQTIIAPIPPLEKLTSYHIRYSITCFVYLNSANIFQVSAHISNSVLFLMVAF